MYTFNTLRKCRGKSPNNNIIHNIRNSWVEIDRFQNGLRLNLIRFRTANFLLIILQISPIWSCQDNLLSIVEPRHLDEDLSSMVLVTYIKAGGGPIKFDLDIIIASVFDSWAISLLAVHHLCSWNKICRSEEMIMSVSLPMVRTDVSSANI